MKPTLIDIAFLFDENNRESIQLQKLEMGENGPQTITSKISNQILTTHFNNNFCYYDATIFLMMVVKNELMWNLLKMTGNDFVIIADPLSINNQYLAEKKYKLNQAFLNVSNCIIYGKIIIVEKRLVDKQILKMLIPIEVWGSSNSISMISE